MDSFPEEDWQLDLDLSARGRHLLRSGLWADVEFAVGEKGTVIKAHRLVLASASPVFADLLYGPSAEEKLPIRIPDVTLEIFNLLLEFIYSDDIEEVTVEEVRELDKVGKKYLVPHLMEACAKSLTKNVTLKNAISCFEFATAIMYQPLKDACTQVFSLYPIPVLETENALDASIDTLEFIFSQKFMTITSELDLLVIIEKYAKNLEDKKIKGDFRMEFVRRLLRNIRFFHLDVSEMARHHQKLRAFLTETELLSLMINHTCEDAVPMPEGFTRIRKGRTLVVPFAEKIRGEVAVGRVFKFVGIIYEDAGRFVINLREHEDVESESNIMFHMSVRFDDQQGDGRVVVRNTYQSGWLQEEREGGMPFEVGAPFEVTIEIERERFKICVDGEFFCWYNHRLPFEQIKYVNVNGQVDINYLA